MTFSVRLQMGDYSVSLKAPGRNKHFRVHVENSMYCIGQRKFHNLDQLGEHRSQIRYAQSQSLTKHFLHLVLLPPVDHYQRAPIYTNKQGEKLYLVRPLPKANGT